MFTFVATYKRFKFGDKFIEWKYIEDLHELQEKLRFKFGNKLSATHIKFKNSIMKVKYAVQVLSSSVADAIEFLRKMGLPEFQGSEETVFFIRTVDRIFDFLNSRSPFGRGYKAPINAKNLEFLKRESAKWIDYLLKLKTASNKPLYQSARKNFILSFVTCIKSVLVISGDLLLTKYYKYILTYKFSQDLLELFFGIVRLRFGCNNNPTAFQFYFAMKTLLLKNDISPSHLGNCMLFAATEGASYEYGKFLLTKKNKKNDVTVKGKNEEDENEYIKSLLEEIEQLDPNGILRDCILYYIAGFVVRKLAKNVVTCVQCKTALFKNTSDHSDHNYCIPDIPLYEQFVSFKNRGGLILASHDVFLIVKECETYVIPFLNNLKDLKFSRIILEVQTKLLECNKVFRELDCEAELFDNHKLALIQRVCALYLKVRIYSLTHWKNSKISKRKVMTKAVLFNND